MTDKAEYKCPLCGGLMIVYPDAPIEKSGGRDTRVFGYTIRCENPCDPQCHENVYGHGGTAKEAHAIACQKFQKSK